MKVDLPVPNQMRLDTRRRPTVLEMTYHVTRVKSVTVRAPLIAWSLVADADDDVVRMLQDAGVL